MKSPQIILTFRLIAVLIISVMMGTAAPAVAQSGEGTYTLTQAIRAQLVKDIELESEADIVWLDLRRFYSQRQYRPLWYGEYGSQGLTPQAKLCIHTLESAQRQGLNPADYNVGFFQRHSADEGVAQRAWVELLLTKSLLLYIEHMLVGRLSPKTMGLNWYIDQPPVDTLDWLQNITQANDFEKALKSLQPPHDGYRRLQAAVDRYLAIEKAGGWPSLPEGPTLQLWDSHEQVTLLRRRLQAEGDLVPGPVEDQWLFDNAVESAVEHFQVRYGIEVDGAVGPQTRRAMNVPIGERIRQMKYNLERWRWLPRDLGVRYLLVNTAAYELVVYEHDRPFKFFRVIAGTAERPTPAVSGPLQAVIFNPFWYIPRKIAVQDILPRQQRNALFFKKMGIRVFRNGRSGLREIQASEVDWKKIDGDYFPYRLRQDPGPKNSLGSIKIKFANDFALYLHDTPKQSLFDRDTRAFSSGCIRVENAIDLAAYLLDNHNGWDEQRILDVIDSGARVAVDLTQEVPLYLVYWTAWVSSDNQVYFRKDVYGWDRSQAQSS